MKSSFWQKIWKGFAILAIFFGLLSPTDIKLSIPVWISLLILTIVFASYLHALEFIEEKYFAIAKYFKDLQADIKFIRIKMEEIS